MKTVVIHQPDFLPYLGFFDRLLRAQLFILLDHVQFVTGGKNSWTHRDKIKTAEGGRWLTVGVKKATLGTPINDVMLADTKWREEGINLIRESYRRCFYFAEIFPRLESLYAKSCERLVDFTTASIQMLLDCFAIDIPIVCSSELKPAGRKNELLVDLLQKVEATDYLSGVGARSYFQPEPFAAAGILVHWQEFTHPVYPQQFGSFVPNLSSVDLLFNCGIEQARQILRTGK